MKYDRTPDKEMKFKTDYNIKVFKTLTEDKGGPVETMILYDSNCREIAKIVKKDGKLSESAATTDAQDSGLYADFAKKFGIKEEDLIYTQSSAAAAQMVVDEDKGESDLKKSGGGALGLVRAYKAKSLKKGAVKYTPEKIQAMKDSQKPENPKLTLLKRIKEIKAANQEPDTSGKALEQKVRSRYGLDKAEGEDNTPVLDYSKMNKYPKKNEDNAPVLDYSTMETPKQLPKWKRDAEAKGYFKQKKDIARAGGLKNPDPNKAKLDKNMAAGYPMGGGAGATGVGALAMSKDKKEGLDKSKHKRRGRSFVKEEERSVRKREQERLKKDVVDLKTRQKIGETGGEGTGKPAGNLKPTYAGKPTASPAKPPRSKDQKISDALESQRGKNPYVDPGPGGGRGSTQSPKPELDDRTARIKMNLDKINALMTAHRNKSNKTEKSLNKADHKGQPNATKRLFEKLREKKMAAPEFKGQPNAVRKKLGQTRAGTLKIGPKPADKNSNANASLQKALGIMRKTSKGSNRTAILSD